MPRILPSVLILLALSGCGPGDRQAAPQATAPQNASQPPFAPLPLDVHLRGDKIRKGAIESVQAHVQSLTEGAGSPGMSVSAPDLPADPTLVVHAPDKGWDLSAYGQVEVEVHNSGPTALTVHGRLEDAAVDTYRQLGMTTGSVRLEAGATGTIIIPLRSKAEIVETDAVIPGIVKESARPALLHLDTSHVVRLAVSMIDPAHRASFVVQRMLATGRPRREPVAFFPLVDRYGQYIHTDWATKVARDEDFTAQAISEERDLAATPPADDRDRWGGWKDGPLLEATGFFRTAMHAGKWWLVDPDGRLFWSNALCCVRGGAAQETVVSGREKCFADLPAKTGDFADCYAKNGQRETFDHYQANLKRKYGSTWQSVHEENTLRRLQSWGFNSIGAWSSRSIMAARRTPYTVALHVQQPPISFEGATGIWRSLPDPFSDAFRQAVRNEMTKESAKWTSIGDPWCIGYFLANEQSWGAAIDAKGNRLCQVRNILGSGPAQPAKQAMATFLRQRHAGIAELNAAWKMDYASWEAFLDRRDRLDWSVPARKADFDAFYALLADTYYRVCKEEIKRAAPNQLYLGDRLCWSNAVVLEAAARHCDVVSINMYEYRTSNIHFEGYRFDRISKPLLISEYSFGSSERGHGLANLTRVGSQEARAACLRRFLGEILADPRYVGAHYFMYVDEPVTGRTSDGENAQFGLVDITDRPYPELVSACREMGATIYRRRAAGGAGAIQMEKAAVDRGR